MKLGIIIPGIQPVPAVNGGAVEVLIEEIINQNEIYKNFEIDLYTIPDSRYIKDKYNNCKIIEVKANFFEKTCTFFKKAFYKFILRKKTDFTIKSLNYTLALRRKLKNSKVYYDYILLENNMSIYESLKSTIIMKCKKLIFHLHNDILGTDKPYNLCNDIINNSAKVLTVSKYLQNRMKAINNSNNIEVFYNCVDFNVFDEKRVNIKKIDGIKKKYNILKQDYVFLYTGRITEKKGVLNLIEAFKKLIEENKNCKLIIVGNSWFGKKKKNEFEKKLEVSSNELKNKIIFTGYIPHNEIPKMLSLVDCVAIPSKWEEPFGVVALEAMAMAKPIIATNSGGLVEQLDSKCAIIVDKNTNLTENLYKAMKKMKNDKYYGIELGKNAYKKVHAIDDFNSENYYKNFVKILKN